MSSSGTETLEAAIGKHWRESDFGRHHHLYILAQTVGGQPLGFFQTKSGRFLHSLADVPVADIGSYRRDRFNRQLLKLSDRLHRRGQRMVVIAQSLMQAQNDAPLSGSAGWHEADIRQWWDDEVSKIADNDGKPPLFLMPTPNYSYDGTGLGTNSADVYYADDDFRRRGDRKDNAHPIHVLGSLAEWMGRFVHYPQALTRLFGEAMGYQIARYAEGRFEDTLQITSASIGTGGDAGKIVLTVNRPVELQEFHIPRVLGFQQTAGHLTYGLVYDPQFGYLTFSGQPSVNDTVTVGAQTYTFKAVLGGGNHVLIGATVAETVANLIAAVNLTAGDGLIHGPGIARNASAYANARPGNPLIAGFTQRLHGGAETVLTEAASNVTATATLAARNFSADVTVTGGGLTIKATIGGGGPVAGDRIGNKGPSNMWCNFVQVEKRDGFFFDHTWGTIPLADSTPALDFSGEVLNDLTPWLAPFSGVVV